MSFKFETSRDVASMSFDAFSVVTKAEDPTLLAECRGRNTAGVCADGQRSSRLSPDNVSER